MNRQRLLATICTSLLVVASFTTQAQVNPPPPTCFGGPTTTQNGQPCCLVPGACGPSCPDCVAVPLNGQTTFLLISGLMLGINAFRKQKLQPIKVDSSIKR